MTFKDFIYMFSDGSINEYITIIAGDFKVLGVIIGSPIVYYLVKLAKFTPWEGDDKLIEKLQKRFGMKPPDGT